MIDTETMRITKAIVKDQRTDSKDNIVVMTCSKSITNILTL
jgi:hypothetical protein